LLQLVAPTDTGDVGLELAESFAAALASTMTLAALIQRAEEQQFVLAQLAGGVGHGVERAVELADTRLPNRERPVRGARAVPPTSSVGDRLSPRQREVLALLLRGWSNAEIAERLVVSLSTVKSHVSAVLRICGAANRSDAIARLARTDAASP
jgi:DNA-binding NarL/FixJ family response regulator